MTSTFHLGGLPHLVSKNVAMRPEVTPESFYYFDVVRINQPVSFQGISLLVQPTRALKQQIVYPNIARPEVICHVSVEIVTRTSRSDGSPGNETTSDAPALSIKLSTSKFS